MLIIWKDIDKVISATGARTYTGIVKGANIDEDYLPALEVERRSQSGVGQPGANICVVRDQPAREPSTGKEPTATYPFGAEKNL